MDEELSADPFDSDILPIDIRNVLKDRRETFRLSALHHYNIGLEEAEDFCEVITSPFKMEGISLFSECFFCRGEEVIASLSLILTDLKTGDWNVRWESRPHQSPGKDVE